MKRIYKKIIVAALMTVSLLLCSGMSVFAQGSLSDAIDQMREQIGNVFSVSVDTQLYSHDDFGRIVKFNAAFNTKNADTEFGILDAKLAQADLSEGSYYYSFGNGQYIFTLSHGSQEELAAFTEVLFPGSTLSLESDAANIDAFRDSYRISESLDFSDLCDSLEANCKRQCVYRSFTGIINDGGGTVDGNTLTFTDATYGDANAPISVEFTKDIEYTVESISVATDVTSNNIVSVAVVLDFEDSDGYAVGQSACAHFIDYVSTHEDSPYHHHKLQFETREGSSSASVEGGEVVTDYRLVMRVEGKPDEVSSALTGIFGKGNKMELSSGSVNETFLFDRNSITHTIDLSQLCEDTGCDASQISYAFSGDVGSNVLALTVDGKTCEVSENSATGISDSTAFTVTIDYRVLDVTALIIAFLCCAAGLCLLAFIYKLLRRRGGKKRAVKREDVRYEAVKSVALALLPEDQRSSTTALEVPSELLNRPTVIIKPKSDDGLDDDDDDPEGVVLFSMILRILLMVQMVLFFFPYFNVAKSGLLDSVDTVTGLDLFLGYKIGNVAIEPDYMSIILFALPLVMLVCLLARRMLPKLALPVAISAGSVFSIFYLLNLSGTIYDRLSSAINAAASSGTFISQPDAQLGYQYTLVIYVMLAIGGVVLLLSSIMARISQRRQQQDEEMRRFEK